MTTKSKAIRYFPLTELIIFVVVATLLFIASDNFNISLWIPILLTLISYFIFLGGTNIILLTGGKIQITYLTLFRRNASIELGKIINVWTTQSYEQELTIDSEGGFYIFKRNYNIEYIDNKDKNKLLSFRISNKKKEREIISAISKVHQIG